MKIVQKKKSNKLKYLMFLFISIYIDVFQVISTYSQDSLFNYLEIAAKNNPTVLQRFSEYHAALQKVPQVGGLPDPELSVGVFLSPMELLEGKQVADIRLMQMFPWFGVLKNAKDEMSLMAKSKYQLYLDARLQVYYDVQRTWYELYKSRQDINISEKNIQILRTLNRLALVRYSSNSSGGDGVSVSLGTKMQSQNSSAGSMGMQTLAGNSGGSSSSSVNQTFSAKQNNSMGSSSGNTSLADLYRIQIEIGDLENEMALLKNQQNTIIVKFNSLLNRPVQSTVDIIDTLKPDSLNISFLVILDSIHNNNPMLGMLQYEKQSLDSRKIMATRMGYPMVGLGVNYSLINRSDMSTSSMNGKDMIMPMVTVTLPIYRAKYKALRTEADIMKSATENEYKAAVNSLQTEYYEALQLYQDAKRRMILYENQSQLAKKSLDIMIISFSSSGSGLTDVLRVRQQMLDYEFKKVDALTDFNTAIAWLKRLGNLEKI